MAKEGTWILGLTEVDLASHPIENRTFLQELQKREDEREEAARRRQEKRKRRKTAKTAVRRHSPPSLIGTSGMSAVGSSEFVDDEFLSDDGHGNGMEAADQEDDPIDIVHVPDDVEANEDTLTRIELENQLKRLFSQSRKNKPKRTLFFVLPNRTKETLHQLIVDNVLPGSTVYTDEWRGYNGLNEKGFQHKTICHQRRFSRFEIDGMVVTRITTNHIERMWVELRRTLKYMDRESFVKNIDLEKYRHMFMYNLKNEVNVLTMLRDMAKEKK